MIQFHLIILLSTVIQFLHKEDNIKTKQYEGYLIAIVDKHDYEIYQSNQYYFLPGNFTNISKQIKKDILENNYFPKIEKIVKKHKGKQLSIMPHQLSDMDNYYETMYFYYNFDEKTFNQEYFVCDYDKNNSAYATKISFEGVVGVDETHMLYERIFIIKEGRFRVLNQKELKNIKNLIKKTK